MKNIVYIASSLDGFIADENDGLDWLPSPDSADTSFETFLDSIDAIVMGKNTFNIILSFGGEWVYSKPVYVVSNSLKEIPEHLQDKVFLIKGTAKEIRQTLNTKGYKNLYIDGGVTIQNFLNEDLIDEMIITTIPKLLGSGKSLFGKVDAIKTFTCVESKVVDGMAQNHFVKVK